MLTTQVLFGITAGILAFVPCPLYIYAILKGETKPDRVTWWILALVSGMIALTYDATGAHETIWLPIGYTASFFIIALFSLRYGDGPMHLHTLDRICLVVALASFVVWRLLDAPFLALLMSMATEFAALVPTAIKAYERPETEDRSAWVVTSVASLLNVLAITPWTFFIALYPVYVFVTNIIITYFIVRRRGRSTL